MANSKISTLTSATTPLAGTETLPIVQSGATTKVTVANLTAGRAVSASSVTTTGAIQASGNFVSASSGVFLKDVNSSFLRIIGGTVGNVDPTITLYGSTNANSNLATYDASSHRLRDVSGTTFLNVGTDTTNYGNFVIGTSGKGIDFTAGGGNVLTQIGGSLTVASGATATLFTPASSTGYLVTVAPSSGDSNSSGACLVISRFGTSLPVLATIGVAGLAFSASAGALQITNATAFSYTYDWTAVKLIH